VELVSVKSWEQTEIDDDEFFDCNDQTPYKAYETPSAIAEKDTVFAIEAKGV
jgi:hypothetical protein